jgi:hypothetical protein
VKSSCVPSPLEIFSGRKLSQIASKRKAIRSKANGHALRPGAGRCGPLTGILEGAWSALGHVWTTPWQAFSDVAAALVGCGHAC